MGVQFESNAKEVKAAIAKLEKQALRETAKLLRKEIKRTVPVYEGVLKKNVGSWVKGKSNETPVLQIGVYNRARARKKGYRYAYHAHLVQFGTVKMQGTDYLRAPVFRNIDKIKDIQSDFIRKIEDIRKNGLPEVGDEEADD
ncbi:HK97 gp10 family phage protein [Desulfosporosinus sp.]|uniref:HK97 gp10 family phage protein n=1 Tax=Desulfosporosinus sp. TaxID=157907 RepID=UPI0025C5A5CE|nr:HK97 gp10 family phage protein [Desulfosporosinus sp.]MBC2721836.1 HK97 gp10 family phage protein [Desulfosporosinus sp.]MBC2726260.1 HK97 gp10 family phage protein [Desulfosporosinus sp.]